MLRSALIVLAAFGPSQASVPRAAFNLWAWSDPHVYAGQAWKSIENPIRDSLYGGDRGGQRFPWNIAVVPGDWVAAQNCPGDDYGEEVRSQLSGSGADLSRIYGTIGNHDADESYLWFRKWINPIGAARKYPAFGTWEHYGFEAGNLLFLVLADRNAPGEPFGRTCGAGYPAGAHSPEAFRWWVSQIEANPDKIIVTVSHHGLENTTIYTGMGEGVAQGIHGNHSRADAIGSSFIYAVGGRVATERGAGYLSYLRKHPGAVSIWIHGHTHTGLHPEKEFNGRSTIERRHGTYFINAGAVTRDHAPPEVPYSLLLQFNAGSRNVRVTPYLHDDWPGHHSEGFYFQGQRTLRLVRAFKPGA